MYKPMFSFEYALVSPDGLYYTGKAGDGWLSPSRHDAFTYTEQGAYAKIDRVDVFKQFSVERLP